jgi:hypothetical protein
VGSPCLLKADMGRMKIMKLIHPRNPPMLMMSPLTVEGKPLEVAKRLAELERLDDRPDADRAEAQR